MSQDRHRKMNREHDLREPKAEPQDPTNATQDSGGGGMDRREFMNYAGLGALAGLSLVALGACDSGGDGDGGAEDAGTTPEGGTKETPRVLKVYAEGGGTTRSDVVVVFSTLLNLNRKCYQFTWNPIPPDPKNYDGDWYENKNGLTYLRSRYTTLVAYAGSVTVKINTKDLGCSAAQLLVDLYGTPVTTHTATVTFP